ncbi:ABC transporter ATP-binding protein [Hirschia litorea]|uniref:ABC transporter ATP-binding protein n=1 Tax=Hirschia litorea TaxID=1199156 RepID=A0ABW2IH43_9PROT
MSKLHAQNLSYNTKTASLLEDASFTLQQGELVVLLGPNGAGKSTLLRAALGLIKPSAGCATLNDIDVQQLSPIERARGVSYLPQIRPLAWPNNVKDVIALGRFSHGANMGNLSETDEHAVNQALDACDLEHLTHRNADTLSGGELARVHCARIFAAQAPLVIADEPVAALDPRHQFRVMDLFSEYVKRGNGALIVLHDINLAARYADRFIWMKDGKISADGPPLETLSEARLEDIYGVNSKVDGLNVTIEGAAD